MYSTWKIKELKAELKKRSASMRGRKADLIERLEVYDRNFNFGRPDCLEDQDPVIQVPPNESYRDINSSTTLPPLNKTQIRHYLNYTTKKNYKAMQLYESRHLLAARSSIVGEDTYLKGYCRKTMKDLQYEVDIKLNKDGSPEDSHCECPAGSGTNALCKHVAVLLLGVEHMVREKILLKFEVCTQRLQQFHVRKKQYTGTPVTAEKLPSKRRRVNIIFEPYPINTLNKENYNNRIRSLVLNFPNSNMPMRQMYELANPYAIESDHNYTGESPQKNILESLTLVEISQEKINEIEKSTREQSTSEEWHHNRRHRLTSSNFHTICHLKPSTMIKYASETIDRHTFNSRATSHGILNEKIALDKYCTKYDLQVEPCGLFISQDYPSGDAAKYGLLSCIS